jgi:hypothetical protein
MKATLSATAVIAVVFATITGFVLAQVPSDQRNTTAAVKPRSQSVSFHNDESLVLGRVLFENVSCVHYEGIEMPANSDGSFGGWVAPTEGEGTMTIFENYIVSEVIDSDGSILRDIRPYDTLGRIEQRIPANAPSPANPN